MAPPRVLIVDNGAYRIKAGFAHEKAIKTYSNGIFRSKRDKRWYVGDQLEKECTDFGGLHDHLPCDRGIVTHWDIEKAVWDRTLGPDGLNIDPSQTSLLLTEPVLNLPNVQEHYDQMVFEEYDFQSYLRVPAAQLCAIDVKGTMPECAIVIDAGFSFTHVVPMLSGEIVWSAVRRVDVGGKLLTNHLKELLSFRQTFVMDQTHVVNAVKEALSFASLDFANDLERCHTNPRDADIARAWVLPDFAAGSTNYLGFPLPEAKPAAGDARQMLWLANERFSVPEVLFRPSTIASDQAGLADAVCDAIAALPDDLAGLFWANVLCVGGTASMPGFGPRLQHELRARAPVESFVAVRVADDPTCQAVRGGRALLKTTTSAKGARPDLLSRFVSRDEYLEHGSEICRRRFGGPALGDSWRPLGGLGDLDEEALEEVASDEEGSSDERKKAKRLESRIKEQARVAKSKIGAYGLPLAG